MMELAVCIGRVCGRDPWVVYEWYDFMLSFPEQTPQKWHMDGIYSVLGCIIPLDDKSSATEFADIDGCDARRCSEDNRVKKVQQLTKLFAHPTNVVFHYRYVQCLIRHSRTITFPDQPARSMPGIYCSPTRSTCTVNPTRGALQKTRYGGQYSQVCVPPTNLRRFFLAFSRSARPPSVGVAFWGWTQKGTATDGGRASLEIGTPTVGGCGFLGLRRKNARPPTEGVREGPYARRAWGGFPQAGWSLFVGSHARLLY
jgi:hypothetical protein